MQNRSSRQSALVSAAALVALIVPTAAAQVPKLVVDPGEPGDRFGLAVASIGDFDGDLSPDFAVASSEALVPVLISEPEVGGAVRIFDASGNLIGLVHGTPGARFGAAVTGPIDRLPGRDDLVIGVAGEPGNSGRIWLVSSISPLVPIVQLVWSLPGLQAGDDYGAALTTIGDVDGDGVRDIVVGAPGYDTFVPFGGEVLDVGAVQVVSGADGIPLRTYYGVVPNGRLGTTLAAVGDVDGDGMEDFAAGSPFDGAGTVRIYSTTSNTPLVTYSGSQTGERFGASIVAVGDVDGGGAGDLLIGAPGYTIGGFFPTPAGRAVVIRGENGGTHLSWGGTFFSNFGHSVACVDLEGDGQRDFAVHRSRTPGTLARTTIYSRADGSLLHTIVDGAQDGDSPLVGVPSIDALVGDELLIGLPDLDGAAGGAIFYGLGSGGGPGPAAHYTVDDDGPADFDSVAVAILSVAAGSILEVEPGNYQGFTVDRTLSVIGRPGDAFDPHPAKATSIEAVGTSNVVVAGFETKQVTLAALQGRTHLADTSVTPGNLAIDGCSDVLVTDTDVIAAEGFVGTRDGIHAVEVTGSAVQLISGAFRGASGGAAIFSPDDGGRGGDALRASGSEVRLADSQLIGGDGGQGGFGGAFGGVAGTGARALDGSTIEFRGNFSTLLQAGQDGIPAPVFPAFDAYATGLGNSVTASTGLTLPISGLGAVSQVPPRPVLRTVGTMAIGTNFQLQVMAELGDPVYLLVSAFDVALELPGFINMPVWADAAGKVLDAVVVGNGFGGWVAFDASIPNSPALPGLALTAQAFAVPPVGAIEPSNAAQIVVRQ
ncbi:integrin alpha [Engelhardtia mirabilis]|uniref:FG-GAP repeat protein n=1 Tax=Engelhardtia mirabilis TaxID=2528011 RepID=A0A518BFD5_9BACT|nr:FG-GAP repeat protein [Planctomycetes bacterium Pla133]QDU99997.1 FG-GAP repeat protein [Planctomycetes bacterium Pla86]